MQAYSRQHQGTDGGCSDPRHARRNLLHKLPPVVIGIAALVWVLIRTGRKPSRVTYPCQRAALVTSWAFLGAPLVAAIAAARWKRPVAWATVAVATGWAVFALGGGALFGSGGEVGDWQPRAMPAWTERDRPFEGRVVEVRDPDATYWDYATGYYGDYVDQDRVDAMVTAGLLELTGRNTVVGAWAELIPDFESGKKLAIKVNLNNAGADPPDNEIDALIHPVNALLGGLIEFGFEPSDITVYDVTRAYHNGQMPQRFIDGCEYEGVVFEKYVGNPQPFSDTAAVHFDPPTAPAISDRPLARCLVEADYLISMPILKRHDYAGVTLSFKNHFGTIDNCLLAHDHVFIQVAGYDPSYNALIDLFLNPHVGGKTVLVLCDALYGNYQHLWGVPPPWPQYGNDAPSTVILGADAVAVDCVCHDILYREGTIHDRSDDYLVLAGSLGLGVYERESAPGVYSLIDHRYLEPPFDPTGVDGPQEQPVIYDMLSVAGSPSAGPTLKLHLPESFGARTSLTIYNARGQLVTTLMDLEPASGDVDVTWDGTSAAGGRVASGVYWARLDYAGHAETEKLLLVR